MSSELSIGNEIKDGHKETYKWVLNNIKWLSELEAFYRDRAKLEKEYSSKLANMTGEYFSKKSAGTVALSVGDTPTTTPGSLEAASLVAWNEILSQTEKVSQDHAQLAQELEFQVADPIVALSKKCEFLLTTINGFNTELTEKRDHAYATLEKAKKTYDDKCVQMENARAKQTKSSSDRAQRKAGDREHEMNVAKNHYLIKINQANRIKDKYYFQDVPEALDLLQDLNESRTRVLNSIWISASTVERDMCKRIDSRLVTADSVVLQNKSNLDTAMFIKHNMKEWKEPADFQYTPSSVWHDDEQFVVSSNGELQDLKVRLAKAQQAYEQMNNYANSEIGELTSLNKQKQEAKSQDSLNGQQVLALLSKYSKVISSYTSHETAKLEAEVEIESIQNNVANEHDLNTDDIDLAKLGKKSGVFNRFKKSLTISSEKKPSRSDKADASSVVSADSKGGHHNRLSLFRGRDRAESDVSRMSGSVDTHDASVIGSVDPNKNRVLYSYQKQDVDEVNVTVGDNITLLTADSGTGWTKIKNETTGNAGLVPTSYVEIREKARTNAPPAPLPRKAAANHTMEALYNYEAQEDGELSILEGDFVTILRGDDGSGWTYGEVHGQKGLFPTSYCK
ncbi:LANO_0E11562g1_1 [Lachancea nothofagi CBS 11611]|uniref:Protein BZZ1 n=1 Tax=Lachancea nothofagi CBS 11611 TaxID=1266666 RepID=A0A1G4JXM3_9SACH|nr:LANO_0E11562g1_1 [Lachancea nothofagi CBS 11611]